MGLTSEECIRNFVLIKVTVHWHGNSRARPPQNILSSFSGGLIPNTYKYIHICPCSRAHYYTKCVGRCGSVRPKQIRKAKRTDYRTSYIAYTATSSRRPWYSQCWCSTKAVSRICSTKNGVHCAIGGKTSS